MAINKDIITQVNESINHLTDYNKLLGRGLMQPFKPANSGSRALMNSIHDEHLLVLDKAEVPIVGTGYEFRFGEVSSSYVTSDRNFKVIAKIDKFKFKPNYHYYLIIQDLDTGVYDVLERVSYYSSNESYGYLWKNDFIDSLSIGSTVSKDTVLKTSNGYDEYYNKKNGVNLLTFYCSLGKNMEDSVILSRSAAKKMATNLINDLDTITINDNDNLLNLYGDDTIYKAFPDIGENIINGIFCSIMRKENTTTLFTHARSRTKDIMLSNKNILANGTVADIDIYCNSPEALGDGLHNQQLYFYYTETKRFNKELVDIVAPLEVNGTLSYNLKALYSPRRAALSGMQYWKDGQFNNVHMEVKVIEYKEMEVGDKMADRYGGKGVVSLIVDDKYMPVLDNGMIVDCIKNTSTCINRENLGQLHELSLNFIGMRIIDVFKQGIFTPQECVKIWYDFVSFVDTDEANMGISGVDIYDDKQCGLFVDMILESGHIYLSTPAFTTPVNIDTIRAIYQKFPWIHMYSLLVPITDSNGNIRRIWAQRKIVAAPIYNYRLKQYAEEKFSVTSLSATNLKNLNTKSRANKAHEARFTKTPIMFGPMESSDMAHMGIEYVVMCLMLYSSSPQAREMFKKLLVGDPYDIDIRLDNTAKNRNAEIIEALLKTMGLRLVFRKIPKVKKYMALNIMAKPVRPEYDPRRDMSNPIVRDKFNMDYKRAINDKDGKAMVNYVMCKIVEDKK